MNERIVSPVNYAIQISSAWGNKFPVDVSTIAFEMSQRDEPIKKIEPIDLGADAEGLLVSRNRKWLLAYNSNIRESGKINFTIAHEFGHYLCHRGQGQFLCTDEDLRNFPHDNSPRDIEQGANEFASFLLMPAEDFRKQITDQPITLDLLRHCSERYGTSITATALKLIQLTSKPCVLVVSKNNSIRWGRSSQSAFKNGVYFKTGTPLPPDALASQQTSLTRLGDAALWQCVGEVNEFIVPMPTYESVLTFLEFDEFISPMVIGVED